MSESESEYVYRRTEDGEIRRGIFHQPNRHIYCQDCGTDVTNEFYMVHDELWDEYVMIGGWLCVPCLEHRIGRRLTRDDFKLCPINVTTFRKTERLLERMGGEPLAREDLLRPHEDNRHER